MTFTVTRFFLLCLLCFPFWLCAQTYPIHVTDEGYIILQANLADGVTGNFILDTGAGANVVSASLFEQIATTATKAGYFTGFRHDGDRLDGTVYEIPFLAIDETKQLRPKIGVYPPLDDYGIDGLLSLKFFEDRAFTLDFSGQTLEIITSKAASALAESFEPIPLSLYRYTDIVLDIFLPIQLNDSIQLWAEFDTGSGYGTYLIHPGYMDDLGLDKTKAVTQPYRTPLSGEDRTDTLYTLTSLSVGTGEAQVRKENVTAVFREKLIHNALIGSDLFKDHKVTIDIPGRVLIIH